MLSLAGWLVDSYTATVAGCNYQLTSHKATYLRIDIPSVSLAANPPPSQQNSSVVVPRGRAKLAPGDRVPILLFRVIFRINESRLCEETDTLARSSDLGILHT